MNESSIKRLITRRLGKKFTTITREDISVISEMKIKCPKCGSHMVVREDGVYAFECGNPECWHTFGIKLVCKKCEYIFPLIYWI